MAIGPSTEGQKRHGEREREEQASGGEGGRDAVGERTVAGVDRHEDPEPERAAEVVGDVDHAARHAGVAGLDSRHPGTREAREPEALADAEHHHRDSDTQHVARAAIIQAGDWARPTASDAAMNSPMPITKVRRRPRRSPTRAPSSSRPPKVSV
jgi:hypothetical protein